MKISIHTFYQGEGQLYYVTGVNTMTRHVECINDPGARTLFIPLAQFTAFQHRPDITSWHQQVTHDLPPEIQREFGVDVRGQLMEALTTHPRRGELLAACERLNLALPLAPSVTSTSLSGRLPTSGSAWRRWMMRDLELKIEELRTQQRALEDEQDYILRFE